MVNELLDDIKPALVWALFTAAGHTIHDSLHFIGGIVSIGYTFYKIFKDIKNSKNDNKN